MPWTAVLGRTTRPVIASANGTWFTWVVASQSVAVLAATLEPGYSHGRPQLALLAVFSWSVGVFLYPLGMYGVPGSTSATPGTLSHNHRRRGNATP